jgi:hypothetical protein
MNQLFSPKLTPEIIVRAKTKKRRSKGFMLSLNQCAKFYLEPLMKELVSPKLTPETILRGKTPKRRSKGFELSVNLC